MRSAAALLSLVAVAILTVALGAATRGGGSALASAAPASSPSPTRAATAIPVIPPRAPKPTPSLPSDVGRDARVGVIDSYGSFGGPWRYDGAKGILTSLALPAPSPRHADAAPDSIPEWSVSPSGRYRIEQRRIFANGFIRNTELWLVDALKKGPSPRLLYAPSSVPPTPTGQPNPSIGPYVFQATQYPGSWSPDERYLTFWDVGMVSGSMDADGRPYVVIDVLTGATIQLGNTLLQTGAWRASHTLAYVAGGGRFTWDHKTLRTWRPEIGTHDLSGPAEIGLAPAWDGARVWFVTALAGDYAPAPYFTGQGIGDRRVAIVDTLTGARGAIPLPPGYAAEGVRPSADGRAVLLLLRRTTTWLGDGSTVGLLELWIANADGSAPAKLMTLSGSGFGYYGAFASLNALTWTRP